MLRCSPWWSGGEEKKVGRGDKRAPSRESLSRVGRDQQRPWKIRFCDEILVKVAGTNESNEWLVHFSCLALSSTCILTLRVSHSNIAMIPYSLRTCWPSLRCRYQKVHTSAKRASHCKMAISKRERVLNVHTSILETSACHCRGSLPLTRRWIFVEMPTSVQTKDHLGSSFVRR